MDEPERDDNAVADDLLAFVLANGGTGWARVGEAVAGKGTRKKAIRDNLLAGDRLLNRGTDSRMKLWHADDPLLPNVQDRLA